jgi:serpin B
MVLVAAGACVATAGPTAADMTKLAEGNNHFATDLYGKLKVKDGNLFYSPYSISTALAMTYLGARGGTERQMADTMHFELGQAGLHPAMADLQARLGSKEHQWKAYELNIANGVWVQDGFKLAGDFVKSMGIYYTGGLDQVDFQKPEEAAAKINGWVGRQTKEKIKELFEPKMITKDTRLVLVNAIYFKGLWEKQFDKELTKDGDFHVSADKKVVAPMMHKTGDFMIFEDSDLQVLWLPYKGGDLSMIIFLPRETGGIGVVETVVAPGMVTWWLDNARRMDVDITLPRFKMTGSFELSDTLSDMGMTDAFTSKADFSGMDGSRQLFISHVIHKAFVEVNEEGTEAAAATGVGMALTAAPTPRQKAKFIADHPFVFVIRDNRTHANLFMGRVVNPTEGGDVK